MSDRPVFVDPVSSFGGEVGDGRLPGWFTLVALLLLVAAGFYAFSYYDGPALDSRHTFREGAGIEVPAESATEPES